MATKLVPSSRLFAFLPRALSTATVWESALPGVGALSEGSAATNDRGFQSFNGESNELVMEERGERSRGNDPTTLHMQNFLAACQSRNHKDLNDEIEIANLSAAMCHPANIGYRVKRMLTLEAGPKFTDDPEANKLLTRDYREPYVV